MINPANTKTEIPNSQTLKLLQVGMAMWDMEYDDDDSSRHSNENIYARFVNLQSKIQLCRNVNMQHKKLCESEMSWECQCWIFEKFKLQKNFASESTTVEAVADHTQK